MVLNDGFDGGDFNIHDRKPPFPVSFRVPSRPGQLVCFCSEAMHSVGVVTAGMRHVLFTFLTCDKEASAQGGVNNPPANWDGTKENLTAGHN